MLFVYYDTNRVIKIAKLLTQKPAVSFKNLTIGEESKIVGKISIRESDNSPLTNTPSACYALNVYNMNHTFEELCCHTSKRADFYISDGNNRILVKADGSWIDYSNTEEKHIGIREAIPEYMERIFKKYKCKN